MSEKIRVKVFANEHANLDSLPLRYGIHFLNDTYIDLTNFEFLKIEYGKNQRHHYIAEFTDPNNPGSEPHSGHFVIFEKYGEWSLVTVWRDDDDKTEFYLSELLKQLRRSGTVNVSMLLKMHPLYLRGELNTSAAVVEYLYKNLAHSEISKIKESERISRETTEKYIETLKATNEKLEKQRDLNKSVALQAIDIVETLEKSNDQLAIANDDLKNKYTSLKESIPDLIQAALTNVDKEEQEKSKDGYLLEPAKQVTKLWNSKTGSTYKNIGIEASIVDVKRMGTRIQLSYIDKNGQIQTITDFGIINGFVQEVFDYLNLRKESKKRAVLILTFKPHSEIKLASDTMRLPEYAGLWRN